MLACYFVKIQLEVDMFKCQNCAEPLTVKDKFNFSSGKLICKKCSHELKLSKVYYFAILFFAVYGSVSSKNSFMYSNRQ
ncbi:hypothetical protein CTM83_02445 [Photobacterium leiognathi subsp. mandapamensis]|nr:hypothetical protein CTM83_02445 [Photobacterium leiognathi subsp. mandapamensis]